MKHSAALSPHLTLVRPSELQRADARPAPRPSSAAALPAASSGSGLPEARTSAQSPALVLHLSEQGRTLLSHMAEEAPFLEAPEDTIEMLVAEGIEEGFLDEG